MKAAAGRFASPARGRGSSVKTGPPPSWPPPPRHRRIGHRSAAPNAPRRAPGGRRGLPCGGRGRLAGAALRVARAALRCPPNGATRPRGRPRRRLQGPAASCAPGRFPAFRLAPPAAWGRRLVAWGASQREVPCRGLSCRQEAPFSRLRLSSSRGSPATPSRRPRLLPLLAPFVPGGHSTRGPSTLGRSCQARGWQGCRARPDARTGGARLPRAAPAPLAPPAPLTAPRSIRR